MSFESIWTVRRRCAGRTMARRVPSHEGLVMRAMILTFDACWAEFLADFHRQQHFLGAC